MLEGLKQTVIDFIFPIFCALCGKEGEWFCRACLEKNKIAAFEFSDPKAEGIFKSLAAFFDYKKEPLFADLLKQFKYHYSGGIVLVWQNLIELFKLNLPQSATVIPVPLHASRIRWRGFNQAATLASLLGKKYGLTADYTCLVRRRATKQQAKLNWQERQTNVKNSFGWVPTEPAPSVVILVDDVYTTGATLMECAKVLKSRGTKSVWGVVLARD